MAPDISLTLDPSDGSVLSDDLDESGEIDLDDLDTPSEPIVKQMSRQVSRGSAVDYQADERAGVARLSWRVSGR